jgi:hypothetical protein
LFNDMVSNYDHSSRCFEDNLCNTYLNFTFILALLQALSPLFRYSYLIPHTSDLNPSDSKDKGLFRLCMSILLLK